MERMPAVKQRSVRKGITAGTAALFALLLVLTLVSCGESGTGGKTGNTANSAETGPARETRSVRILATSDLHGKFMPWDYSMNEESRKGSAAQLSSAIADHRTDETLLVDAGDLIQGNFADLFVHRDGVHPMVRAMNQMGYDVWVTGNHDYNFGMDTLRKTIADLHAEVLTGNVYDESGAPIAAGWKIFTYDGVRVAVIGMVTPNIARWDKKNLEKCTVTDPLEETRRIIDSIQGQYDALVGVYHMGIQNEYEVPNSGVTDICNACPEFDVMISAHEHRLIESMDINGVLVVQNRDSAQTMSVIDLSFESEGEGWKLTGRTARSAAVSEYDPDPAMMKLLEEDHKAALEASAQVIGVLKGGTLVPEKEPSEKGSSEDPLFRTELPAAQVQDTALTDLINRVQLYYSGADVSASPLCGPDTGLDEGDIHLYDTARIYSFDNTLYTVRMNGRQLKKLMEWTASYFNTVTPEAPEITADPEFPSYNYLIFEGVSYEIDLTCPAGERIRDLAWPDGKPVEDEDTFLVSLNNYNAASQVLQPGVIFTEDDLPELEEMDIRGDLGGIRELIRDYIVHAENGVLTPECSHNWRIVIP